MEFNFSFFNSNNDGDMPVIFDLGVPESEFISTDVQNIYTRILTDVLERTEGVPKEQENLLWDNCLADEMQDGLVTLIAKAMVDKKDLFLVYDKVVKLIRKATPDEEAKIREDYKKTASSKTGIYITFRSYNRTDMVKLYSGLEYSTIASLGKQMNISKALQVKISELRSSVSLKDKNTAKAQATKIANALKDGKDVAMDAKDILETLKPDLTATQAAMDFISNKQSFYLGLPASWITGQQSNGLGDTGKADTKAVERGLRSYYFSIIKPVLESIFGITTSFKSEDFDMLDTAINLLKTFELTSSQFISDENKNKMINKVFGLPADAKGDKQDESTINPNNPGNPNDPSVMQQKGQQPGTKPAAGNSGAKPNA